MLLVLDNHGSHTTPKFRTFCEENDIIPLWMPPHCSHLLQSLDVGSFGPLKTAFSKQNQDLIRNHIFHVAKVDFLASFHTAFLASFTQDKIKGGFMSGTSTNSLQPSNRLWKLTRSHQPSPSFPFSRGLIQPSYSILRHNPPMPPSRPSYKPSRMVLHHKRANHGHRLPLPVSCQQQAPLCPQKAT